MKGIYSGYLMASENNLKYVEGSWPLEKSP